MPPKFSDSVVLTASRTDEDMMELVEKSEKGRRCEDDCSSEIEGRRGIDAGRRRRIAERAIIIEDRKEQRKSRLFTVLT